MNMPPKVSKKISDDDESFEKCLQLEAELTELKDELRRIHTQRLESDKENDTLRNEIRRTKAEFEKQLENKQSNTCRDGTQTDVGNQTDNIVSNQNNILNMVEIGKTNDNLIELKKIFQNVIDQQIQNRYDGEGD